MTDEANDQAPAPITVAEQKSVDFYGDELVAIRDEESTVWVPVRHLCEALGVDRRGQMQRIERDPVLSTAVRSGGVTHPDGRTFQMECLPLKYVRAWLFGINANRVKPELREKLIVYQREVIEIIDRAFSRATMPAVGADEAHIIAMRDLAFQQASLWDTLLAEKRRLDAVQQLAEEHEGMIGDQYKEIAQLQGQIDELRRRQVELEGDLNRRLTALSDRIRLLPAPRGEKISTEQKAAIKALVDDIVAAAEEKGIRLGRGRNDYPAVWDAFKRRFDLAEYGDLTAAQYNQALAWLKAWLDRIRAR